jgi:hypothetical protein
MFRRVSLSIIRSSFFTVHTAMVYVIQVLLTACKQEHLLSCQQNLYNIYHCCVYSKKDTPDDGQRNCPKHVEFHSKNKFEKSVHLVGSITRKY